MPPITEVMRRSVSEMVELANALFSGKTSKSDVIPNAAVKAVVLKRREKVANLINVCEMDVSHLAGKKLG